MSLAAGAGSNEALVRVVNGPLVAPVLSRVVGMLAARAQCPVDRLDDALLVTDAIAAHSQAQTLNGCVTVRLQSGSGGLRMTVDELREGGAAAMLAEAALPGVGNLIERIADEISIEPRQGREAIVLRLSFGG